MTEPARQSEEERLVDIQNSPDTRQLAIDRVGVKNLRFPLEIREKGGGTQSTVATVSLTVDLPHHYKGTHMSRFIEVLSSHGSVLDVQDMSRIPAELRQRLDAEQAHVEFRFPFFIEKEAPVTGGKGVVDYTVTFQVNADGSGSDFILTVEVPVTTLCPCSKAISARGAHNQRGVATCSVRFEEPMWAEDLIALVEGCASSELYSLLKRPDEKEVTERAYDRPVFVEDLVRNVALACERSPNITWYRVEAENYESIHNHNAYALIEQQWG